LDPTPKSGNRFFLEIRMAPAKAVLKFETVRNEPAVEKETRSPAAPPGNSNQANSLAGSAPPVAQPLSVARPPHNAQVARPRRDQGAIFQARVPVITGEAVFRGLMPVDGVISGQLGASSSGLTIKQRPRSGPSECVPELNGEITFKDMLRVNGHIAGKVSSEKGTLIVDPSAVVDGDITAGVVVISGIVNGDVVGRDRVELGPAAVINGNISTRSLAMKPGAVFQGDCRMLNDETI
jgi:cytoskeletal protein CcmA (bactofilin family)